MLSQSFSVCVPKPIHGTPHSRYASVRHHRMRVSCLSWKWRECSAVKITERTREERTEALHSQREGGHLEASFVGEGADLGVVRGDGTPANGLLPLAERVL